MSNIVPLPFASFYCNVSSVHLHECFDDKKPEAGAIWDGARSIGGAIKFFKHFGSFRRRYSDAVVAYQNIQRAIFPFAFYFRL